MWDSESRSPSPGRSPAAREREEGREEGREEEKEAGKEEGMEEGHALTQGVGQRVGDAFALNGTLDTSAGTLDLLGSNSHSSTNSNGVHANNGSGGSGSGGGGGSSGGNDCCGFDPPLRLLGYVTACAIGLSKVAQRLQTSPPFRSLHCHLSLANLFEPPCMGRHRRHVRATPGHER